MKNAMKLKLITALIAVMLLLIFANAKGQGVKISALPTLSAPDSSADYIPIVHSGTTYKVTPGKLFHEFGASGGGGSVAGSNTHIQYNNAGAFGSSADFTWNNSSKLFKVSSSALYTDGFFKANLNSYYGFLGDSAGANNGTYLEVNDDDRVISLVGQTIKIGSSVTAPEYAFPSSYGSAGSVLLDVDGTGTLAWGGIGGAAGSDGEIQFNDGDAFDASPNLIFDEATNSFFAGSDEAGAINIVNSGTHYINVDASETGSGQVNRLRIPSWTDASFYFGSSDDGFVTKRRFLDITGTFKAGDVDNYYSGDLLTVNISTTGTSIKSLSGTGTRMVVASSTGVLSTQTIPSGTGTVTSIATTSPITGGTITTTGTIGIDNAAADGTTKGAASFTAADFNSSSGLISIDYTNGQAATSGQKGFLTSADWSTFNGKQAAGSYLTADGAVTGASSVAQPFNTGIKTPLIDDNASGTIDMTISEVLKAYFDNDGLKVIDAVYTDVINERTSAAGVTIDGVLLKDGLVLGQYGGTGVNNSGKTITLGGNLTTSGAHATTLTTTGTTGVTLPTTGTLATLAGTETFTNKSIVATQLTGTSYTFAANNTGSTAAYTLQPYEDHNLATYSGTVDFNGTDPASITSQQYAWSRVGNTVTLFFSIFYGTPGTTNTSATITMPSDLPAPVTFATGGDAASEYIFPISGARVEANMTANPSAVRGGLRRNAANDGYEVLLIFGSVSAAHASFTLSYRTQ